MVNVHRTRYDTVELSPEYENDRKYLVVRKNTEGSWEVAERYRGVVGETLLSSHSNADEAVAWAKNHIESVEDELSDALGKHGL